MAVYRGFSAGFQPSECAARAYCHFSLFSDKQYSIPTFITTATERADDYLICSCSCSRRPPTYSRIAYAIRNSEQRNSKPSAREHVTTELTEAKKASRKAKRLFSPYPISHPCHHTGVVGFILSTHYRVG